MQLSKAQVISLFLGATQADTIAKIINGSTSVDTTIGLPVGYNFATAQAPASSLTECTGTTACQTANNDERCGAFQTLETGLPIVTNVCIHKWVCGTVGKMNGVAFSAPCWAADVAPAVGDAAALLTALGAVIRPADADATYFDAATFNNWKVPAMDNFQTGWWTLGDDAKWRETDKAVHNVCVANSGCAADECCANWPDSNNRRCTAKTLGGVEQTLPPLIPFTPVCAVDANAPPKSAKDDLADKAKAEAASALKTFHDSVEERAKEVAKYTDMSADEKTAWDAERVTFLADRATFDDKLRADAGIDADTCDNDCKAVFDAEFLKWKKAVFETCKTSKDSIDCRDYRAIKSGEEERRKTAGFYSKGADDRKVFEDADDAEKSKAKSTLIAAWMDKNKPEEGKDGAACEAKKCGVSQCCGTSTPESNAIGVTTGQLMDVCVDKAALKFTDGLGRQYSHQCGAKALLASATALVAAAFLM